MKLLLNLLINTLSVFICAYILPGVDVDSIVTAGIVAIVLGVLNTFLKPILVLLALPITILTLGLFTLVINGFLVFLVSNLVPGFIVTGWLSAILFTILLSLVSGFLDFLSK